MKKRRKEGRQLRHSKTKHKIFSLLLLLQFIILIQFFKHFYTSQRPPPLPITFRVRSKVVKRRKREGRRPRRLKMEFKRSVFEARAYCATATEQVQGEQEQTKFYDLRRGITEDLQRLAKFQRTLSKSTKKIHRF